MVVNHDSDTLYVTGASHHEISAAQILARDASISRALPMADEDHSHGFSPLAQAFAMASSHSTTS